VICRSGRGKFRVNHTIRRGRRWGGKVAESQCLKGRRGEKLQEAAISDGFVFSPDLVQNKPKGKVGTSRERKNAPGEWKSFP